MINDIGTRFLEGCLDEQLTKIEIRNANSIVLQSSTGRLFTTSDNKLTMHVHASSIQGKFPTNDYEEFNGLQVVGTTQSGWKLKSFVFLLKPLSYMAKEDMALWSMEPFEVELQRFVPDQEQTFSSYDALIDKVDCLFELGTTRMSPEGKASSMALDWLRVETELANIQLHRGDSQWSTVRLEAARQQLTAAELEQEAHLFLRALSLRMGRRIDALATTIKHRNVEVVQLGALNNSMLRHSGNTPLIPLIIRNGLGSTFIKLSMDHLRSNDQSAVLRYLYSVWDGELISRDNHRLQLAIAVEGLSQFINKSAPGAACTQAELNRREEEKEFSKLKEEVLALIETIDTSNFVQGHFNRLKNVIKRTSLNDTAPMIKSAGESLGITFADEELKCWKSMRHGPAHGDLSKFDETEADFWACLSMLYRMVLRIIGWSGPVIPYGGYAKYVTRPDNADQPKQVLNLSSLSEIRIQR